MVAAGDLGGRKGIIGRCMTSNTIMQYDNEMGAHYMGHEVGRLPLQYL